jgi:hypothetical protein
MQWIGSGNELDWEFQIQDENEFASNLKSVVWVRLEFVVGIKGCTQFQFSFGCTTHRISCFLSLGNLNLTYMLET